MLGLTATHELLKNQIYKLIGEMINWILLLIFNARIDDH